jgi:hypothetical protein
LRQWLWQRVRESRPELRRSELREGCSHLRRCRPDLRRRSRLRDRRVPQGLQQRLWQEQVLQALPARPHLLLPQLWQWLR